MTSENREYFFCYVIIKALDLRFNRHQRNHPLYIVDFKTVRFVVGFNFLWLGNDQLSKASLGIIVNV